MRVSKLMPLLPMRPKKAKTAPTPAAAAAGSQRLSRAYDSMAAQIMHVEKRTLLHHVDSDARLGRRGNTAGEVVAVAEEEAEEDDAVVAAWHEPRALLREHDAKDHDGRADHDERRDVDDEG